MHCFNDKRFLDRMSAKYNLPTDPMKSFLGDDKYRDASDAELEAAIVEHFKCGSFRVAAKSAAEALLEEWKAETNNGIIEFEKSVEGLTQRAEKYKELAKIFGEENMAKYVTKDNYVLRIAKPEFGVKSKAEPKAPTSYLEEGDRIIDILKQFSASIKNAKRKLKNKITVSDFANGVWEGDDSWSTPSTTLGNTIDKIVRHFFQGNLKTSYPNLTSEQLKRVIEDLEEFKADLDEKFKGHKYKVVTDVFNMYARMTTKDANGDPLVREMVGSVDMIIYDDEGNFYIYDTKVKRSGVGEKEYHRQLSAYKALLEANFPQLKGRIKELNILEFSVHYPAPVIEVGEDDKGKPIMAPNAEYTSENGQLMLNGQPIQNYPATDEKQKEYYVPPRYKRITPRDIIEFEEEFEALDDFDRELMEEEFGKEKYRPTYTPDKITQNKNSLYNNPLLSAEERSYLSSYIMKTASLIITDLQQDPTKGEYYFGDSFKGVDLTSRSRSEIVDIVGLNRIFAWIKENHFNTDARLNDDLDIDATDKLDLAYDNWDALLEEGYTKLIALEEVSIKSERDIKQDDGESSLADEIENGKLETSEREYWQVNFRQVSLKTNLSALIRRELERLQEYTYDSNGKLVIKQHPTFKLPEFIDANTATQSIMEWCKDCSTLEEMETVLKGLVDAYPWLAVITGVHDDVNDIPGLLEREPFRSQFFVNFRKDFTEYSVVLVSLDSNGNRVYTTHTINTRGAASFAMDNVRANLLEGRARVLQNVNALGKGTPNVAIIKQLSAKRLEILEKLARTKNRKATLNEYFKDITEQFYSFGIPMPEEILRGLISQDLRVTEVQNTSIYKMLNHINYISKQFTSHAKDEGGYNPIMRDDDGKKQAGNVYGDYQDIINYMVPFMQDGIEASTYQGGKMYYSFQTPSYMGKVIRQLSDAADNPAKFAEFLQEQYKDYKWFYDADSDGQNWRNLMLQQLETDSKAREGLAHKVQLSFGDNAYKDLSEMAYTLSLMSEFFFDKNADTGNVSKVWAWYRVPILSNKPSSEFIKFYRYVGNSYKKTILRPLVRTAKQELMRMQAVLEEAGVRGGAKIDHWSLSEEFLAEHPKLREKLESRNADGVLEKKLTFDDIVKDGKLVMSKSGAEFKFMATLNDQFVKRTELGKLMLKMLNGEQLDTVESSNLNTMLSEQIEKDMNHLFELEMVKWRDLGLLEKQEKKYTLQRDVIKDGKKQKKDVIVSLPTYKYLNSFIPSSRKIFQDLEQNYKGDVYDATGQVTEEFMNLFIETQDKYVNDALENYMWNDLLATINIIQLTATDLAYYKNVEDFQKRYAAVHSPGLRMNTQARDSQGRSYSADGMCRVLHLMDSKEISDIKENVRQIFEERIDKETNATNKEALRKMCELILSKFDEVDLTDGQGYSAPTSYRKKMGMMGRWNDKMEQAYERIVKGTYNVEDLGIVLQPLKPFVYTQMNKTVYSDTMPNIKVSMQVKDSEYLLLLADALMRGNKSENKLTAIFDFMEDTAYDGRESNEGTVIKQGEYNGGGIDTVAFVSTSKFGSRGVVDISDKAIAEYRKTHNLDDSVTDYTIMKHLLKQAVYQDINNPTAPLSTRYNDDYVHTFSFEDYALQQEVPVHLMDKKQPMGSQIRILSISDVSENESFEISNSNRTGDKEILTGAQIIREYQELTAENIEDSFNRLAKEFNINSDDLYERNKALSKILREAIQKDSRYGSDLMRACTIIEDGPRRGEFTIPLCDPIQSIRVQQLINSIIKREINKQEFRGGSIVQTSVFGMSDDLSIRFQDKDGKLLQTFAEFVKAKTGKSKKNLTAAQLIDLAAKYKKEVVSKQGRMAYWEVYITVPSEAMERMLKEASARDGIDYFSNLDKAVENGVLQEEQLKAIGYRIPTEDKYSAAPMKIKGFLPRAAGEALMMPKEVTLLTGSDFDIDKMYILLKDFSNPKFTINNLQLEKKDKVRIIEKVRELHPEFVKEVDAVTEESFSDSQKIEIFDKIYETVPFLKEILKGIRDASGEYKEYVTTNKRGEEVTKRKYDWPVNHYLNNLPDNAYATQWKYRLFDMAKKDGFEDLTEWKQFLVAKAAHELELTPEVIEVKRDSYVALDDESIAADGKTKYEVFKEAADALNISLKEKVMDQPFIEKTDRDTRSGRNNRIFDLQWAILTANDTAIKMFNPGSFEVQKRSARIITILKNSKNNYTYRELSEMSLEELEDIAGDTVGSNILLSTTQVYFHKQNMTAGKLIGIFANNNTSHAFLSLQDIMLDLDDNMEFSFDGEESGSINGTKIDNIYARDGITFISKNIAGYLAASVDAVKDPVLNFLNLNTFTSGPAMLLARLGFDVDSISLFMTQPVIERLASEFFRLNNESYVPSDIVINNLKLELAKKLGWSQDSFNDNLERMETDLSNNTFTKDEMAENIGTLYLHMDAEEATYQMKVLLLFQRLMKISNQLQQMTFLTKFNSVSNAPGPSIADTLVMQYRYLRFQQLFVDNTNYFSDNAQYIIENSPILNAFYKYTVSSQGASARIFREHFPHYSQSMQDILQFLSLRLKMQLDAKTINMIINDYVFYKLTAGDNPVIDMNRDIREFYIKDFAEAYKEQAKDIRGNALLELIGIRPGDYRCPVPTLEVKSGSFNNEKREVVNNAWTDLITNPDTGDLGVKLFIYNLTRSGFSFSPKTFGHCAPVDVRLSIPRYIETLRDPNFNDEKMYGEIEDFVYQFLRNHANNPKLVPSVEDQRGLTVVKKDGKVTFSFNKKYVSMPFILDSSNIDENHISPVIWYDGKLYMQPSDISDLGGVSVTFTETTPLGNPNNFLEYNAEDANPAYMKSVFDVHNRSREEGYVGDSKPTEEESEELKNRQEASDKVEKLSKQEIEYVRDEVLTETERFTFASMTGEENLADFLIRKIKEHFEAIKVEANRGKDGQGTVRYKKLKAIVDKLC